MFFSINIDENIFAESKKCMKCNTRFLIDCINYNRDSKIFKDSYYIYTLIATYIVFFLLEFEV